MFVMIAVLEQNCAKLRALGITGVSDWDVLFRFLAKVGRGDKFRFYFNRVCFVIASVRYICIRHVQRVDMPSFRICFVVICADRRQIRKFKRKTNYA